MNTKILLLSLLSLLGWGNWGELCPQLIGQSSIPIISKVINDAPNLESFATNESILRGQIVTLNDINTSKEVQINLFEDIQLMARQIAIDKHKNGATVWRGAISDQKWGYVLISQFKNTYWIKVELDDGRIFQIQPELGGAFQNQYLLSEQIGSDEQGFDCEGEVLDDSFQSEEPSSKSRQKLASVCDVDADCSGKVVHIMVIYTPASSQYFGGDAATESAIAMAVSEMNTINSNSGINHTFNLTHTQIIDYTEDSGSTDFSRLSNGNDGMIDEVHVLRNQYGADVVSMVVTSACGLAQVNTNPTSYSSAAAFSIVGTACMATNKSLAHEVGHNMGLRHDRYAYGNSLPTIACDWAWGFVNPNGVNGTDDQKWRTVMAYGDFCFDNGFGCGRIPHWSNPDINYNGDPTGVPIGQPDQANSAYMLNRAICLVSDFVEEPPCHPDFLSLKSLYAAADGGNWGVNWDTTANGNCAPCSWDGIQCNVDGRVIALDLSNKALDGFIPLEIGWLNELEILKISNATNLSGTLPDEIRFLQNLKILDLSNNNLTGELPNGIGKLQEIEQIVLAYNSLTGAIPRKIGTLPNLTKLDFSHNNLSAFLPSSFGILPVLDTLLINDNQLTGPLPKELANLSNTIEFFKGDNNDFSDCFPVEFAAFCGNSVTFTNNPNLQYQGDFTQFCANPNQSCNQQACTHPDFAALEALFNATNGEYWNNNQGWLSDCDPCQGIPWNGVTCIGNRVTSIFLINNSLSGMLPPEIGQLTSLETFWAITNNLSGPIPTEIGQLTNLYSLNLSRNNFTGIIPNEVGQLSNLEILSLVGNDLVGPLPPDLVNAPLTLFSINSNPNFSGCYPATYNTFCNINFNVGSTMLPDFQTFCNDGTGTCVSNCHPDFDALKEIYAATDGANWTDNTNWDTTATAVCNPCNWFGITCDPVSNRVTEINLPFNDLDGVLPDVFAGMDSLSIINLYLNEELEGTLPISLGTLPNLTSITFGQTPLITGPLPPSWGNLTKLETLNLGFSGLTGDIPISYGNLINLTYLSLMVNNLTGPIPDEFGNLVELRQLYLRNNNLTGQLPESLGNLVQLDFLKLENNLFDGCYPASYVLFCSDTINATIHGVNLPSFSDFCDSGANVCLTACAHPDFVALDSFYQATNGAIWNNNAADWLSNCDPCGEEAGNNAWEGIFCTNNRVTGIALGGKNLTGTLPPEIGDLSELNFLNLAFNSLTGFIPPEIGNLSKLKWSLRLDNNQFTGNIPPEIGNLSQLTSLDLWNNQLDGTLPEELGNLPLNTFKVQNNTNLLGCYPSNYTAFCNINAVDFSGTMLPSFNDFCNNGSNSCTANDCPTMHTLAAASTQDTIFKAAETIISTDTINASHTVTYEAGQLITLLPGFEAKAGATFTAKIADCSTNLVAPEIANNRNSIATKSDASTTKLLVYPNPFSTQTTIEFTITKAGPIQIQLMDLTGRALQTVVPKSHFEAGIHQADLQNNQLQPGIYFIQLTNADKQLIHKIIVL